MKSKDRVSLLQISRFVAIGLFLVWPAAAWAQTVVTTIPLGARPGAVAVNPVTNKIYVAACSPGFGFHGPHGSVTVIDGQTNAITTIAGICPTALAVNPVTNKIYSFDPDSGAIVIIDGATNSTTMAAASHSAVAVAVNSATNKIYFANSNSSSNPTASVTVLDGATNSIATIVDPNTSGLGLGAVAIAVNSATNKIYVANSSIEAGATSPGNITVIDGATNSTTTITDPNAMLPFSLAVNSGTNKVYVANLGEGTNHGNITVIDGATNSITTVTDPNAVLNGGLGLDSPPFAVAVDSATNKIYVANAGSNNVTAIDSATNATTTLTDPNARGPVALAVDSVTDMIYVANSGTNPGSVTVINGATNAVTTVIDPNALGGPIALAVDPTTDKIYVANSSSNATVIDGSATATSHILALVLPGFGGSGTVTSNPAGINCTSSCTASFAAGTPVSLTAAPGSGSTFSGWSTNCTGTGACNLTLHSDEFVMATFNLLDFSIAPASTALTAQRGGQATDVITIASQNGFNNPVQLSCAVTGSTPLATCSLSSTSVTPGANSVTSTLTITAPTQSAQLIPRSEGQPSRPLYAVFLPIPLALIGLGLASGKSRNRTRSLWLLCSLTLALAVLQVGCGGGGSAPPPPPPLNYTVTVTATSGAIQHSTQVAVTVQ